MAHLAIIGGTGLSKLLHLKVSRCVQVDTPFGEPSAELVFGDLSGAEIVFLPRHGSRHTIPPHQINYRANIWALKELGVRSIVAVAAVGGISGNLTPAKIAIPDQLIDYTYGRKCTFFEDHLERVTHIDLTWPYTQSLRERVLMAALRAGLEVHDGGVYGCTQGPRLETAAEVRRMERDGCHMVGMTGMPEAALARELEMDYACCAVVANRAAGKTKEVIAMAEIDVNLARGMQDVSLLLQCMSG
jgi:5'-methylthioinosine phosphorylase